MSGTWKNTRELMQTIYATHRRLVTGEISVEQARAEATALKSAVKMVELEVEVAKCSGKLRDGKVEGFEFGS